MHDRIVLIVDDDENDAIIAKRVLSKIDPCIGTKLAASGEAAVDLLENEGCLPSLILLDLKMRGMDGIEVLRKVRGDRRLRHIPVVVVTHSTLESDRMEAHNAGADSFLQKAFDMNQFGEDLRKVMAELLS